MVFKKDIDRLHRQRGDAAERAQALVFEILRGMRQLHGPRQVDFIQLVRDDVR